MQLQKAMWKAVNLPTAESVKSKQPAKDKKDGKSVRCRYCKFKGHEEKGCRKKKKEEKDKSGGAAATPKAAASGTVNSVPTENAEVPSPCFALYELDSGSPTHIPTDRNHFVHLQPDYREERRSISNNALPVLGIGTVRLTQPTKGLDLLLHEVRFCPGAATNIVSVRQLELAGLSIDWQTDPSPVTVLDDSSSPTAEFHRLPDGFYAKFRIPSCTVDAVAGAPPRTSASADLWHKRFGHINHRYVKNSASYSDPTPQTICGTCVQAKQTKTPGPSQKATDSKPFDRVFVDLGGGRDALPEGASITRTKTRQFIVFTDEATRYRWCYPLEKKPDTTQATLDFLALVKTQFGKTPKSIRSDGGREFNNDDVAKIYSDRGIHWEPTAAKCPEHNGVSERSMRTLMQTTRAMIFESGIPRRFWPYALEAAVHVWNRTSNQKPSPYELLYGKPPGIDHLRVFGCLAHAHDPSHKSKLDSRSKPMCFVGYSAPRVWLLLDPRTKQVVRRRDVVFDEQKMFDWSPFETKDSLVNYRTTIDSILTPPEVTSPSSFREATTSLAAPEWHDAMRHEIDQLSAAGTWDLVPRASVPKSSRILTGKWVYRRKADSTFKARWVVRGFNEDDLDIGDTYAATLQATTVRLLFAWAVQNGYAIRQADISSAFLNSAVDRDIYMLQPTGFATGRHVCKLNRSLYGLRTAPKDWYNTLASYLGTLGFTPSKFDQCLFVNPETKITLSVFVDDINVFGPDDDALADLLQKINQRFKLRDLGSVSSYLGMEVSYDRPSGHLKLTQKDKILKLLEDAQLLDCIPRSTPFDPGQVLPFSSPSEDDPALGDTEHIIFRARLGALLHIACFTRPDIIFAVSALSRVQNAPTNAAASALRHVLRYLKGTIDVGLTFRKGSLELIGWSDSSWASATNARSTTGNLFTINGTPVLWESKLQTVIARSTCEAEYVAADAAAREATWLQLFWHEICQSPRSQEPLPIPFKIDNQSAVKLIFKEGTQTRNRHFLIRTEAIREAQRRGIVDPSFIPSSEMAADGFTKPLSSSGHKHFMQLISMG